MISDNSASSRASNYPHRMGRTTRRDRPFQTLWEQPSKSPLTAILADHSHQHHMHPHPRCRGNDSRSDTQPAGHWTSGEQGTQCLSNTKPCHSGLGIPYKAGVYTATSPATSNRPTQFTVRCPVLAVLRAQGELRILPTNEGIDVLRYVLVAQISGS